MLRPEQTESRALHDLRHSPVMAFLTRSYDELRDMLVTQRDPDVLRTLQGQAQVLRELMALIDPEVFSTSGKRG